MSTGDHNYDPKLYATAKVKSMQWEGNDLIVEHADGKVWRYKDAYFTRLTTPSVPGMEVTELNYATEVKMEEADVLPKLELFTPEEHGVIDAQFVVGEGGLRIAFEPSPPSPLNLLTTHQPCPTCGTSGLDPIQETPGLTRVCRRCGGTGKAPIT